MISLIEGFSTGNIVGRLGFSLLSGYKWVKLLALYNLAVTIAGTAMFVSVYCTTFVTLAIFAAVFGVFIGNMTSWVVVIESEAF